MTVLLQVYITVTLRIMMLCTPRDATTQLSLACVRVLKIVST